MTSTNYYANTYWNMTTINMTNSNTYWIILPNILGIIIIQERGIPESLWKPAGLNGMIEGFISHCSNVGSAFPFRLQPAWLSVSDREPGTFSARLSCQICFCPFWRTAKCDLQPFGHPNPLKHKVYGMVIRWSLATVTPGYRLIYAQDCRLISTTSPTLELSAT